MLLGRRLVGDHYVLILWHVRQAYMMWLLTQVDCYLMFQTVYSVLIRYPFSNNMHHYRCVVLNKAISLQIDQFWAAYLASCSLRPIGVRLLWIFFIEVVRSSVVVIEVFCSDYQLLSTNAVVVRCETSVNAVCELQCLYICSDIVSVFCYSGVLGRLQSGLHLNMSMAAILNVILCLYVIFTSPCLNQINYQQD